MQQSFLCLTHLASESVSVALKPPEENNRQYRILLQAKVLSQTISSSKVEEKPIKAGAVLQGWVLKSEVK